ncbi:MAG: Omp28-related outer membrane protein [Candidatus Riflebacteria bacterium]|nr:Omp28-related outer membrane protein [Candidatus Riflebacteria bacterium]
MRNSVLFHMIPFCSFFVLVLVLSMAGCRFFENNPESPGIAVNNVSITPIGSENTASVKLQVILPQTKSESLSYSNIRAFVATQTPTVTFKLVLVNLGNSASPTITFSRDVQVSQSGAASTTFEAVPVLPALADIHIARGTIASISDFHGAADLATGSNQLEVVAKGSGCAADVISHVIEDLIASPTTLASVSRGLVDKVKTVVTGLSLGSPTIYQDSTAAFINTFPMNRVALLEDFTGVGCGACPYGHIAAKAILDANPGKFIVLATHSGPFASPYYGYGDFTTTQGEAINLQANTHAYPSGTMNRMKCSELGVSPLNATSSLIVMNYWDWSTAAAKAMTLPAPVNIVAKALLATATRILTVKVDLYYTAAETVANNLNVSLSQDKLLSSQKDYSLPDPYLANNYEQNNVLRDMISSGNWGDPITEPTTAGSKVSKTYTYTVPTDYHGTTSSGGGAVVISNLSVVVFVTRGQLEILNALKVSVQ